MGNSAQTTPGGRSSATHPYPCACGCSRRVSIPGSFASTDCAEASAERGRIKAPAFSTVRGLGDSDTVSVLRVQIDPCPKPRQTRQDTWKKRPAVLRYRAFADQMRAAVDASGFDLDLVHHFALSTRFYIPVPPSLSNAEKRRRIGQPHQMKPDIDNLIKAVLDALWDNDCHVWALGFPVKRWTEEGKGRVELAYMIPRN